MSWRKDLNKDLASAVSLVPAARSANTAVNGTGVDLQNYQSSLICTYFGVVTDGTHTPKLQESDDNSTFTDVAAGDQSGTFAAVTSGSGGSAIQEVGYLGSKRYIRVVLTTSGATTGALCSAFVIRGGARNRPQ